MKYFKDKLYPGSVTQKVLAGFLLVFVAILLALGITHFAFREMMVTVDKLSTPNKELNALNEIFQEITAMDQLQRAQAILNPRRPYKTFLSQSKSLVDKIDSLRMMEWDSTQQVRLGAIRNILIRRNQFFFSYLSLKSKLVDNPSLAERLDTLSRILEQERIAFDTSVVTTEKKTVTTYSQDSVSESQKDERSRLGKLFGKKKKVTPQTTHVKVQEELRVIVDTLSVARQNKALEEVEKIIIDLENDQQEETRKLLSEELELIHANSLLINQLLSILHEVENQELAKMQKNNDRAAALVTQSNSRITTLLLVFFIGAAMLVYLIWADISRSNYYKAQLEKTKDEAVELSQIKQRFLSNMSHEIRTPLQSIIGYSEQLKRGGAANKEAVEAINSSSEHLLQIVDEILDYSRISNGSFTLSREHFALTALVKEVAAALKTQAERKKLSLVLDLTGAGDYTVLGDPFRLRQILYNLVGNAIKFTSSGYVKLALNTTPEEGYVNCTFEISDTGIGIGKEDLSRIFNKFEQANASIARTYGGTGLGLSIVKLLVEAQGGSLNVTSDPGSGSTFSVSLKFENSGTARQDVSTTKKRVPRQTASKVLVVDDDTMILKLCSLILEGNKIPFVTYNDPLKVSAEEPDPAISHVLIDIRMPAMNGVELCSVLRAKYDSATKFVALTAHVLPQEQQELLLQGFDFVLPKPFRERDLLNLLGFDYSEVGDTYTEPKEINLTALKRMTHGDDALFLSILTQFIEETESDLNNLDENIRRMDQPAIRETVHKLAGRIGQLGDLTLSTKLRTLENMLADNENLAPLTSELAMRKLDIEALLRTVRVHAMAQSES